MYSYQIQKNIKHKHTARSSHEIDVQRNFYFFRSFSFLLTLLVFSLQSRANGQWSYRLNEKHISVVDALTIFYVLAKSRITKIRNIDHQTIGTRTTKLKIHDEMFV